MQLIEENEMTCFNCMAQKLDQAMYWSLPKSGSVINALQDQIDFPTTGT